MSALGEDGRPTEHPIMGRVAVRPLATLLCLSWDVFGFQRADTVRSMLRTTVMSALLDPA